MEFELNSNLIDDKRYENWWRRYSKSSCEYGVGKKTLKRHNSKNTPFHASSLRNGLNKL
jgi:hypothetical protein